MEASLINLLKEQQASRSRSALLNSSPFDLPLLAAPAPPQTHPVQSGQTPFTSTLEKLLLKSVANSQPSRFDARSESATLETQLPVLKQAAQSRRHHILSSSLTDRQRFALFVKVLFKYIERLNSLSLKLRAKAIIAECTQLNRLGVAGYTPLMSAVERRMKESLGEIHWERAQICMNSYIRKRATQTIKTSAMIQGL